MKILVIKRGALGDVVRTSYFARALKLKYGPSLMLYWSTAEPSAPLLRFNPYIDEIRTDFQFSHQTFDHVFSLDDEREALEGLKSLSFRDITGAYLDHSDKAAYTDSSSEWFDMGLLSRFGKDWADRLKKENQSSHGEIFSRIFGTNKPEPHFYGNSAYDLQELRLPSEEIWVGINPFAGGRWPSKELRESELILLIKGLEVLFQGLRRSGKIFLMGAGKDRLRNEMIAKKVHSPMIHVVDSDATVLRFASVIKTLDCLITSDSLAMHLAIAQRIPFVAFFSPTSAAEIDDFGFGEKVRSTAPDYCSYRPDADNVTITAERLLAAMEKKLKK